jgi:hypothetical protein
MTRIQSNLMHSQFLTSVWVLEILSLPDTWAVSLCRCDVLDNATKYENELSSLTKPECTHKCAWKIVNDCQIERRLLALSSNVDSTHKTPTVGLEPCALPTELGGLVTFV